MMSRVATALLTTLATLIAPILIPPGYAAPPELVSITTPRGAKQALIVIKPEKPVASLILFAGGHGALGLKGPATMKWGAANFLVRSRDLFARQNFLVAVVDAPSDRTAGMNAVFRMGKPHADDIAAVAQYLKKQADAPVWLVGTSMGTFSAAAGAIAGKSVDGLVLSSTITRAKPEWKIASTHPDGVASMRLAKITVPTLILSHRRDACDLTPAADSPKLKSRLTSAAKVDVVLLDGGDKPQSEACQAKSPHGFFGIEGDAVQAIATFIQATASH